MSKCMVRAFMDLAKEFSESAKIESKYGREDGEMLLKIASQRILETIQEVVKVPESVHRYVVGFMFSADFEWVALIRKQKPLWQAGLLNGIGGKVEPGEEPFGAMTREFEEEAGLETERSLWTSFCSMGGVNDDGKDEFLVNFFACIGDLSLLQSQEQEQIEIVDTDSITAVRRDCLENLPWLVALAVDCLRDGRPYFVLAKYAPNPPEKDTPPAANS